MYYVIYDPVNGALLGGYIQDLVPEHESIHIEVDYEITQWWFRYRANAARDGVELIPVVPIDPNPPVQVPEAVSMLAARLTLVNDGLIAAARAYVAGLPEGEMEAAMAYWECASTVKRDHALVLGFQLHQELTDVEVDALFIAAAEVE
jgi:hypothetical protein